MTNIDEIDFEVSQNDLLKKGLTVENIVSTLNLNQEFDLRELREEIPNTEYEPETHPFLVYRPENVAGTVLLPTNGQASLVGCSNKSQIEVLRDFFVDKLEEITEKQLTKINAVKIQNIVVGGQIGRELDLNPIVVLLGMEKSEYEPEQFPGVIYRPENGCTILIFGSGKFMITGITTFSEVASSAENLFEQFREAGIL